MGRECSTIEASLFKLSLDIHTNLDIIFPNMSRRTRLAQKLSIFFLIELALSISNDKIVQL